MISLNWCWKRMYFYGICFRMVYSVHFVILSTTFLNENKLDIKVYHLHWNRSVKHILSELEGLALHLVLYTRFYAECGIFTSLSQIP